MFKREEHLEKVIYPEFRRLEKLHGGRGNFDNPKMDEAIKDIQKQFYSRTGFVGRERVGAVSAGERLAKGELDATRIWLQRLNRKSWLL